MNVMLFGASGRSKLRLDLLQHVQLWFCHPGFHIKAFQFGVIEYIIYLVRISPYSLHAELEASLQFTSPPRELLVFFEFQIYFS